MKTWTRRCSPASSGSVRAVIVALLLAMVVSAGMLGCVPSSTMSRESSYFPGSGHYVWEPFLSYYQAAGGAAVLGEPISDQRLENSAMVQYFANVRLEWDPIICQVRLSSAGLMLGYSQPAVPQSQVAKEHPEQFRYYRQTGHTLAPALKAFYDANGGPEMFGFPIGEVLIGNGLTVQYFERACLEWDPGRPEGSQVCLGKLGHKLWSKQEQALKVAQQRNGSQSPAPTLALPVSGDITVMTLAKYQFMGQGGHQVIDVRVIDQVGQGVPGVRISVLVHDRGGDRRFQAPPTDAHGHTSFTFPGGDSPAGYAVVVDVVALYQNREIRTQTSYVPWTPTS